MATSERARHAIETRWSRTTDPEQRRAATGPARLAAAVKAVVDQAPNLTDEQRNRLRVILTRSPAAGRDQPGARQSARMTLESSNTP